MPKIIIQCGHKPPYPWSGFGTGTDGERQLAETVGGWLAKEFLARKWGVWVVPSAFDYTIAADIFISLHADGSGSPTVRGFSIGWDDRQANAFESEKLARRLAAEYRSIIKPLRAEPFNYTINQAHYYAFKRLINVKAKILLEMGFMTNPEEREFLENHPALVASVIARGLVGERPISIQDESEEDMPDISEKTGKAMRFSGYNGEIELMDHAGQKRKKVGVCFLKLATDYGVSGTAHVEVIPRDKSIAVIKSDIAVKNRRLKVERLGEGVPGDFLVEITSDVEITAIRDQWFN